MHSGHHPAGTKGMPLKLVRVLNVVLLFAVLGFAGTGCARVGHLYPANDAAAATGILQAHFMAYGTGHGEGRITMPDGELLTGEYSLVRGGSVSFGSIFAAAGGVSGSATTTTYAIPGGSPGTASLFGDKGTSMQCEFYNDNFSGHGYGGCQSSRAHSIACNTDDAEFVRCIASSFLGFTNSAIWLRFRHLRTRTFRTFANGSRRVVLC